MEAEELTSCREHLSGKYRAVKQTSLRSRWSRRATARPHRGGGAPRESSCSAIWVWNSLWSSRRHAHVDILDAAIFDEPGPSAIPAIRRWLFTAKDGRVRKKAASNTSIGAVKQAFLGRTLNGGSKRDARASRDTGRVFATALMSSGESVRLDEDTWAALVIGGRGQDRIAAVTALTSGDWEKEHRGGRQQFSCEYKINNDMATAQRLWSFSALPMQGSMVTHVLVSSGLLRDDVTSDDKGNRRQEILNGRMMSRIKATSDEVEAKLRCIVRRVQDVRKVHVLSMTALFTVLPPLEAGRPRVWLERAEHVRVLRNDVAVHPPSVEDRLDSSLPPRACKNSHEPGPIGDVISESTVQCSPSPSQSCQESGRDLSGDATHDPKTTQAGKAEVRQLQRRAIIAIPIISTPASTDSIAPSGRSPISLSHTTAELLSAAADAALATRDVATSRVENHEGGDGIRRSDTEGNECSSVKDRMQNRQRHGLITDSCAPNDATPFATCAGEFCAYPVESSEFTERKKTFDAITAEEGKAQPTWAGVCISTKGHALLKVGREPSSLYRDKKQVSHRLVSKSIVIARAEAESGFTASWPEDIWKSWRRGYYRADSSKGISPVTTCEEVSVCQTCHGIYHCLDRMRVQPDQPGIRKSSERIASAQCNSRAGSDTLAFDTEVGAATLGEQLTAMLEDVNAKAGKLGTEAGILWRRRLSKSKSNRDSMFTAAQSQAVLINRLSRPKPQAPESTDNDVLQKPKRQVKSQGDTLGHANSRCRRRTSMDPSFPSLPACRLVRGASSHGRRCGEYHEQSVSSTDITLPSGVPRRIAWPLGEVVGIDGGVDVPGKRLISSGQRCNGKGPSYDCPDTCTEIESRASISAIEAMLKEGGTSYLPACVRDLPEAATVFGCGSTAFDAKDESELDEDCSVGKKVKQPEHERLINVRRSNIEEPGCPRTVSEAFGADIDASTSRLIAPSSCREEGAEERFLHPWQRALEARKRSIGRLAEDKTELARAQLQRTEAREAAATSQPCRRAGRRVAARLRRHRYRRRVRRTGGGNERRRRLKCSKGRDQGTRCMQDGRSSTPPSHLFPSIDALKTCKTRQCDNGDAVVSEKVPDQMRDTLRRAFNTLNALEKRLRKKGLLNENEMSTRGVETSRVARVLEATKGHLAAFENEMRTLRGELRERVTLVDGANVKLLESPCDATCESFEITFCRLVNELSRAAKGDPDGLHINPLGDEYSCAVDHIQHEKPRQDKAEHPDNDAAHSPTVTAPCRDKIFFRLCPSCSVLPVARRCLDCDGDAVDREWCDGCFVKHHRELTRQSHKFLRVSNCLRMETPPGRGNDDTRAGTKKSAANTSRQRKNPSGRCSRCNDIAAARRCRDCDVNMCAACHFLAHRSPSRQAHTTELVGVAAVEIQEALHRQTAGRKVESREGICESESSSAPRSPTSGVEDAENSRCDSRSAQLQRKRVFGRDAAESLAQARRTIDPPVVFPLPFASCSARGAQALHDVPLDDTRSDRRAASSDDPLEATHNIRLERNEGNCTVRASDVIDAGVVGGTIDVNGIPVKSSGECEAGRYPRFSLYCSDGEQEGHRGNGIDDGGALLTDEGRGDETHEDSNDEKCDSSVCSSADESTEDEGMMWSPVNIAKVKIGPPPGDEVEVLLSQHPSPSTREMEESSKVLTIDGSRP